MASIEHDLESFTQFAKQRIASGEATASMDELFRQWRKQRIAAEDAAAVLEAIEDLERGERGVDFDTFVAEFSKRNGLKQRP